MKLLFEISYSFVIGNVYGLYMKGLDHLQYLQERLESELQMYVLCILKGLIIYDTSRIGLNLELQMYVLCI